MNPASTGVLRHQEVARARHALVELLAGRLDHDGALETRCRSRVLESALFLHLLRAIGVRKDLQKRLSTHLEDASPAHPLEELIQRAHCRSGDADETKRFVRNFSHETGDRKRLLISTVLALTGAASLHVSMRSRIPEAGDHAVWTKLTLCALRIIHDDAAGIQHQPDQRLLQEQLGSSPREDVWEGNVLAHLIGLHALRICSPANPLLHHGIEAVARTMNDDGGVPFVSGQDIWVSALAGAALAESGIAPEAVERLSAFIATHQLDDGGWGYVRGTTQSDVDDTSRCALLLTLSDPKRYAENVRAASRYLRRMAGTDGGFPTYAAGHPSEVDLTAGATIALAECDPAVPVDVLLDALDFLLASQQPDGSFEPSWTRSRTSVVAHVLQAVDSVTRRVPAEPQRRRAAHLSARALEVLSLERNDDFGWGEQSDALSTAHGVVALAGRVAPEVVAPSAALLLNRLAAGRLDAPADQVGPRPIPYDFPVLTEVHVLSALNAVLRTTDQQGAITWSTSPSRSWALGSRA